MASSVTLPGANGTGVVTVQAGSGEHIFVAQLIANTILLNTVAGGTADTVTINGGTPTTTGAPSGGNPEGILYMYGSGGGSFQIPTGYNYVIDLMTGPETITGSNVDLVSADPVSSTFNLTNSAIAADPGTDNDIVNLDGTFSVGTGNGNDTVTAIGTGTIGGGTGTNIYYVTPTVGGAGIRLQTNGTDSVTVADPTGGVATVVGTGNNLVLGSLGLVTIEAQLQGNDATITGGDAANFDTTFGSDNIVLGGSGPGAGNVSYVAQGSGDTIAPFGAPTFNVSLQGSGGSKGTGDLLIGGSGTLNVNVSNVWETIAGGSGSTAVTIQNIGIATNELVLGGSGGLTVDDEGQSDTIAPFGASPAAVTLGGSNDLLFGGSSPMTVVVNGASSVTGDTIAAGSGPETITANSAAVVFGNTGSLSFVGGAGNSSVVGAPSGSTAITVGSGGVTFWSEGNDTTSVLGGSGQATLYGGSGGMITFTDTNSLDGGVSFSAGAGNETLNAAGSLTNNFFSLGSDSTGGVTVTGGNGNDTFTAGNGADSMVGSSVPGSGSDEFVFFATQTSLPGSIGAHDYITDWTSNDSLFLIGYDSTQSAGSLMAASTVAGGNLTIKLSDHTEITFNNVTDTSAFNGKILYT